jgi:hypothetical protein
MLSKIGTEISFDKYVTEYNVNDSKSFFDILRIHKDYISHITIYEDADVSLSSYGGSYTFDKLDEKFDLNYPYFDDMYIFFKDDDTCFRYKGFEDKLEVITQNPNFDLDTFLSEKKSMMIK